MTTLATMPPRPKPYKPPKPKFISSKSQYMIEAFEPDLNPIVKLVRRQTRGVVRFDTIVGTGLSGALIVPTVARALGKRWAIVRKQDDRSTHSSYRVEGEIGKRWLFLDDTIASGATRGHVRKQIAKLAEQHKFETEFVGTVTYNWPVYYYSPEHTRELG